MAQKTAVEWLSEKLNEFNGEDNPWFDIPLSILEQAKEMEKQQIIDAVDYTYNNTDYHTTGLLYYNETFKK